MTKNLDEKGLRSIVKNYEVFFIDLWGVVHNGIKLNQNAIDVLHKLTELNKYYILLTNAPRPNNTVQIFLKKMGMDKSILERVYTSGQAALNYLDKNHPFILKVIKKAFGKKVNDKMKQISLLNSSDFKKYKRYMIYLFQKVDPS